MPQVSVGALVLTPPGSPTRSVAMAINLWSHLPLQLSSVTHTLIFASFWCCVTLNPKSPDLIPTAATDIIIKKSRGGAHLQQFGLVSRVGDDSVTVGVVKTALQKCISSVTFTKLFHGRCNSEQYFPFPPPFFLFIQARVDSSPDADGECMNLLSFFLCVSGTTAKHVVFLAGNTAKHGLRCKACKMSLHHKCENRVGMQQRCMGKLVRSTTPSHTGKHTDQPLSVTVSFSFVLTDVISNKNRFNWHPFPSRMCFFRNHSLCVSVLLNRWQPPILVSRLIAVMSPLPLRELDIANVTLAQPAATGRRHYCTFGSMKCLFLVVVVGGGFAESL